MKTLMAVLGVLLLGCAWSASITSIVTWNSISNTLQIGFVLPGNMTLAPGQVAVFTIKNITVSGVDANPTGTQLGAAQSFNTTSPPPIDKTYHIQNGGATITNSTYGLVIVPPASVNVNESIAVNSTGSVMPEPNVTFAWKIADGVNCAQKGNVTPSYNNSIIISNSTCGYSYVVGRIQPLNITKTIVGSNMTLGIGQSENVQIINGWRVNGSKIILNVSNVTVRNILTGNSLVTNHTLLDQIFSAEAGAGCIPGANVTIYDTSGNSGLTLCTRTVGDPNESLYYLIPAYDLAEGNLSVGVGQAFISVIADTKAAWSGANTHNYTLALFFENLSAARNNTISIDQQKLTNQSVSVDTAVGVACVFVIACGGILLYFRHIRKTARRWPAGSRTDKR